MHSGLTSTLLGAIKPSATAGNMPKWKTVKFLFWDERSIRQKKNRNKGSHVNQLERLHLILPEEAGLVYKKRKHYPGTSHGDCIGPILAPDWKETFKQQLVLKSVKLFTSECSSGTVVPNSQGWEGDLANDLQGQKEPLWSCQPSWCGWKAWWGDCPQRPKGCHVCMIHDRTWYHGVCMHDMMISFLSMT